MGIKLERPGTDPVGLEIWSRPYNPMTNTICAGEDTLVRLGDYMISLEDFLIAAGYVMQNTNLSGKNDPRLQFIRYVKSLTEVPGFNGDLKRLESPTGVHPVDK